MGRLRGRKPKYDPISFWFTCGGTDGARCPDDARIGVVIKNAMINLIKLQNNVAGWGWTLAFAQVDDSCVEDGTTVSEHEARDLLCPTCSTSVLDGQIALETDNEKRHASHQVRLKIAEAARRAPNKK